MVHVFYGMCGMIASASHAQVDLMRMLPVEISGWRSLQPPVCYGRENLYEYIDGGAELYLSYHFQTMTGRTYQKEGPPDIIADVFDMGDSFSAFGLFMHARESVDSVFGQGSEYTSGMLQFWKDPWFISILASPETEASHQAIRDLARSIEKQIPGDGKLPPLLQYLPNDKLISGSIRYFLHHAWINSYYFIADQNILHLGGQNSALLAKYDDTTAQRPILIRNEHVLDQSGKLHAEILQQMMDEAVCRLLDESDVTLAWKKIIRPGDLVGIKTNVWKSLPTPAELEQALKKRVLGCGVPEGHISIRDRGLLSDPVFMKATALINIRPMRTHDWSGVGTLLKNYIMFVEKPWAYHPDTCADLAAIWKLPLVKDKTRLNVLVMLTPQFHGIGPHHYDSRYVWSYKGLIAGFDPVACDATGMRIIQAKHREYFGEDRPINPPPKHIVLAETRHHLGIADPQRIDLEKSGWNEGILI
jgi:hypothetical protein